PPQISPGGQAPHESVPSHPSTTSPHCAPNASHVIGVHPQRFATLTPHVRGGPHEPHASRRPQPSSIVPHCAPSWEHVRQPPCAPVSCAPPVLSCSWPTSSP